MDVLEEKKPPRYKRKIGDIKTTGFNYENKVSTLLCFRAINMKYFFNIGTGVEYAEKFDDIVLKYDQNGTSMTYFLQLKHKENPRKNTTEEFNNFFSKKKCKKGFNFFNYFTSFCKLKKNWKENIDCNWWGNPENFYFVLFTNMELNESDCSKYFEPCDPCNERILNTGGCSYKLKHRVKELIDFKTEIEDYIEEFIHKFLLYVNQPSEKDLENIIKEEIVQCYKVSAHGASEIYTEMLKKIQNMRDEEYSEVLMNNECMFYTGEQLRVCINSKQQANFDIYNIELNNECTGQVQKCVSDSKISLNIILTSEIVLSSILVYHSLASAGDNPIIVSTETLLDKDHKYIMKAWPNQWCKHLILYTEANDYNSFLKLENSLKTLLDITNGKGKIILVIKSEAIENIKTPYACIKVPCDFKYLSDDCKKSIMNKEINFQGFIVKFGDIVKQEAENILDGPELNELLLHNQDIPIGGNLKPMDFFLVRAVSHKTFINKTVLNEATDDNVFAITKMDINDEQNFECLRTCELKHSGYQFQSETPFPIIFILFVLANFEAFELNEVYIRTFPSVNIEISYRSKNLKKYKNARAFKNINSTAGNAFELNSSTVHYISNREEFNALCNKYNGNVHWFIDCDNAFIWKESKSDLSKIQKHFSSDEFVYKVNTVENIPGKTVILISEAGMGKTALLNELAFRTKENDPTIFLIQLNLSDSTKCLEKLKGKKHNIKYDDILNFLLSSYKNKDIIWRRMCHDVLRSYENIVVLIDGFDEIYLEYGEIVSDLLVNITEMNIYKMIVTSRPSAKDILEEKLKAVAFKLDSFDSKDQMSFFLYYFSSNVIDKNNIEKLLAVFKDKTFLGIPLHCTLVGEVVKMHLQNSSGSIESYISEINDEIYLYETFIETKFQHYCKKYEIHTNNAYIFNKWRKEFLKCHIRAALIQILYPLENKNIRKIFESNNVKEFLRGIEEGKLNTELINFVQGGRPQFVHRKFAEFLTAKYLFENYSENTDILQDVLCKGNVYFIDVRHILNLYFTRDLPLHNAVYKLEEDKVKEILEKNKLIDTTDVLGRTALHIGICHRPYNFVTSDLFIQNEIVKHLLKHHADVNKSDKLSKCSPFQYLNVNLCWDIVETLLETKTVDEKHILELCNNIWNRNDYIVSVALYAVTKNSKVIVNFLLKTCYLGDNKKKLKIFFISEMLKHAIIHSSTEMLEYLIDTLEFDWKIELGPGGNLLHCACYFGNENAVRYIVQNCKIDLEIKNSKGQSAIAISAMQNNLKILQYFNEKTKFSMSSFNDDMDENLLHYASSLDCTRYLVETCNLNPRHTSKLGVFPVHKAALQHKWDTVEYYVEKCKIPVNATDRLGRSILHYACAADGDVNPFLKKYIKLINVNLRDIYDMVPFIHAVSNGLLTTAKCLANCSETDTNIQDTAGNTGLHCGIMYLFFLTVNTVKFLIEECNINPNIRNNEDKTALDLALQRHEINYLTMEYGVVEYLKKITR